MPSAFDYSKTVRELWALHNAFRRLGFPADDIYMCPDTILHGETGYAGIQVSQNGKTFAVSVPRDSTAEELVKEWDRFCAQLPEFKDWELNAIYVASFAREAGAGIVIGLQAKGFKTTW